MHSPAPCQARQKRLPHDAQCSECQRPSKSLLNHVCERYSRCRGCSRQRHGGAAMTWREALPVHRPQDAQCCMAACSLMLARHAATWRLTTIGSACCDGSVRSSNKTSTERTQSFTRGIADGTLTRRSRNIQAMLQRCSKVVSIWMSGAEATSYIMSRCAPMPTV